MIHPMINIHTITSLNTIINTEPPILMIIRVIIVKLISNSNNSKNRNITLPPFIIGVEIFAKNKKEPLLRLLLIVIKFCFLMSFKF